MDEPETVYHQPRTAPDRRRRAALARSRRTPAPRIKAAWQSAVAVDPAAVAAYRPTPDATAVGLALLSGAHTIPELVESSGLERAAVLDVLNSPVAMAWISVEVYAQFRHRAAQVDAALYSRSLAGDVSAIRLFYERMGQMSQVKQVAVQVSGGIRVDALSDDELRQVARDGLARLPVPIASRVLEVGGAPVAGGEGGRDPGAGAPDIPGAVLVLPGPTPGPPEAAGVPGRGDEPPADLPVRGEPVREDDGR